MPRRTVAAAAALAVTLTGIAAADAGGAPARPTNAAARHVLLLSVDGLHQSDLAYYVSAHPRSALAGLVGNGVEYTRARTTFPSDSFPGMVAQLTGGTPGTTGIYYDDTYNRRLLPPGTFDCSNARPGTEVSWTEAADRSQAPITLDAGQGLNEPALTRLPGNSIEQTVSDSGAITRAILNMTPTPQSLLDPAALPVNPRTCLPIYPHSYLRTNTVFNVARSAGLRTAWSDKHAAYEILNGPSGTGIQDLFTPEINSVADSAGDDWTTDNSLTQVYDSTKVAAVRNEIDGFDHSGTKRVGTPAIFGMNFQTLSTAQKLPTSDGLTGGYEPNGTPGPLVKRALRYIDTQVGELTQRLRRDRLSRNTTVILSAKHGQSPLNPDALRRVDDGAIIDAINLGWASRHPGAAPLIAFSVDDDVMLLWLSNRTPEALAFTRHYLLGHSAPANLVTDPQGVFSTTVPSSGLTAVHTGIDADNLFHARRGDAHAPDVVGIVQHGVVYTGKVKKISEHGGASADDRHVALVVSGAGVPSPGSTHSTPVQTTQIAPTILHLLGLAPRALKAVRLDHTAVLPKS